MLKILVWLCPLFLMGESTLDSQINLLQQEIEELRIEELNDKEKAQDNLRYQGEEAIQDLEKAKKNAEAASQKQKELDLLLQKRNQLSK